MDERLASMEDPGPKRRQKRPCVCARQKKNTSERYLARFLEHDGVDWVVQPASKKGTLYREGSGPQQKKTNERTSEVSWRDEESGVGEWKMSITSPRSERVTQNTHTHTHMWKEWIKKTNLSYEHGRRRAFICEEMKEPFIIIGRVWPFAVFPYFCLLHGPDFLTFFSKITIRVNEWWMASLLVLMSVSSKIVVAKKKTKTEVDWIMISSQNKIHLEIVLVPWGGSIMCFPPL